MTLRLREIGLHLDEDEEQLVAKIAECLSIGVEQISAWRIVRKAVDARRKSDILRVYTVDFACRDETEVLERNSHLRTLEKSPEYRPYTIDKVSISPRVLIVGMGPAGLFSALALVESGARVTLIERGKTVAERLRDVHDLWDGGGLQPESNIQFGEGGAGTFSDGKLTCRLNHPATRMILERLVRFGAPEDVLIQAKPHIGSDRLRAVLVNFRNHLLERGVQIHFSHRLTGLDIEDGSLRAGIINDSERIECDYLILATGHSARDTYEMLADNNISLEKKAFAIGLRVEHPLELIDRIQYGTQRHTQLPAADYRLTWNDPQNGRGVYSFCMCPGGWVVNAASEPEGLAVNGMSNFHRDTLWSNSALVVTVGPDDFSGPNPLAGVEFQRYWEKKAFLLGGANYCAPAQPLLEYLHGKGGRLESSFQPRVTHAGLKDCLPGFVDSSLRRALPFFNQRMRGFVGPEACLIGVETRTSSPVRIVRKQDGESISLKGLYPAGEGAGYAGGIMSAALDGLKVAEKIIQRTNEF